MVVPALQLWCICFAQDYSFSSSFASLFSSLPWSSLNSYSFFQGKHWPFTTIPCLLRWFIWCLQPFACIVGWVHSPADSQKWASSLWDHCSGWYGFMFLQLWWWDKVHSLQICHHPTVDRVREGKQLTWQRTRLFSGLSTGWRNGLTSHEGQQSKYKDLQLVWNNPIQHYTLRDGCVENNFVEELRTWGSCGWQDELEPRLCSGSKGSTWCAQLVLAGQQPAGWGKWSFPLIQHLWVCIRSIVSRLGLPNAGKPLNNRASPAKDTQGIQGDGQGEVEQAELV